MYEEELKIVLGKEINRIPDDIYNQVIGYLIETNKDFLKIICAKLDNTKIEIAKKIVFDNCITFLGQPIDVIKSQVLEDENFEYFINLYNSIYNLTVKKASGELIDTMPEEEKERLMQKMDEYLSKIQDFNLMEAKHYYFEFLTNINYLCGSNAMSLDVHNAIQK